jgi:hypothetical protein
VLTVASFESKVSGIFDENPRFARKLPLLIRQIFQESDFEFKQRLRKEPEDVRQSELLRLYDILYIDFYFTEFSDRFLNWVIDNYSDRFDETEIEEMRAQAASTLDFYEVQKVIPGQGSYIRSLMTKEEGFLKDVSSSSALVKWDIILTRCYRLHGDYYATGALASFKPADKEYILTQLRKAWSESRHHGQYSEYTDFAKEHWGIFFQIERQIRKRAMNRKLYTNYGELQFCEVRFRVQHLQTILEKIRHLKEFNFIETRMRKDKNKKSKITRYQFDWLTLGIEKKLAAIKTGSVKEGMMFSTSQLDIKGNQLGIEVIGNLYIDQFLCRLETRSLELAEFAVPHFELLLGDALTFKRIIKKNIDIYPRHKRGDVIKETAQSPQVPPELIGKIEEDYYLKLLDKKIPALDNMTPRSARRDTIALPLLLDWLKGLENMFERKKLKGERAELIKKIKKELEIDW